MTKPILKHILVATGTALMAHCAFAALPYANGDLFLGFHATGGTGAGESYVVNLGQANLFTGVGIVGQTAGNGIGNLNADLSTIFGANWGSRSDLSWGIAGSNPQTGAGAGQVARTLWASAPEMIFGIQATPWNSGSSTTQGTVSSRVQTMEFTWSGQSAISAANPWSVREAAGSANSWGSFNLGGISFGQWIPTIENSFGGGVDNSALDVFYMAPSSGAGALLNSFTLDGTGNVHYGPTFVPEPGTFSLLGGAGLLFLSFRRQFRGA